MTKTELSLEDVAGLHTLEELLGVKTDTTDELERARSGVALDAELGLDGSSKVLLLDTEEDRGGGRRRSGLGRRLAEVELKERSEVRVADTCKKHTEGSAPRHVGKQQAENTTGAAGRRQQEGEEAVVSTPKF